MMKMQAQVKEWASPFIYIYLKWTKINRMRSYTMWKKKTSSYQRATSIYSNIAHQRSRIANRRTWTPARWVAVVSSPSEVSTTCVLSRWASAGLPAWTFGVQAASLEVHPPSPAPHHSGKARAAKKLNRSLKPSWIVKWPQCPICTR